MQPDGPLDFTSSGSFFPLHLRGDNIFIGAVYLQYPGTAFDYGSCSPHRYHFQQVEE
jgi:hypothetical protein